MIEVRKLTKKYGSRKAVSDLSFKIEDGTITGFLGPNGGYEERTVKTSFVTYALNSNCNIAAQSRIEGISDYSVYGMLDDNPAIYVYTHSETLPFGYAAEYFLESVTTDEETE